MFKKLLCNPVGALLGGGLLMSAILAAIAPLPDTSTCDRLVDKAIAIVRVDEAIAIVKSAKECYVQKGVTTKESDKLLAMLSRLDETTLTASLKVDIKQASDKIKAEYLSQRLENASKTAIWVLPFSILAFGIIFWFYLTDLGWLFAAEIESKNER